MIASVRGQVLVRRPDHVVVEAAGVGYRLAVSAETLKAVPAAGSEATLHAQLVVRDDSMQLYGFASEEERDLFVELTAVSGIGPKVAIAILSGGSPRELLRAIAAGDAKRFQAVPGIGKRTSEEQEGEDQRALARDGLMHLGYTLIEADRLLESAGDGSAEEMISAALRSAAQSAGARG